MCLYFIYAPSLDVCFDRFGCGRVRFKCFLTFGLKKVIGLMGAQACLHIALAQVSVDVRVCEQAEKMMRGGCGGFGEMINDGREFKSDWSNLLFSHYTHTNALAITGCWFDSLFKY